MEIKQIATTQDYESALQQIEELWNFAPHSIEEQYLGKLSILVEEYESQHFSMITNHSK